jgi:hypothetical protein
LETPQRRGKAPGESGLIYNSTPQFAGKRFSTKRAMILRFIDENKKWYFNPEYGGTPATQKKVLHRA